LSRPRAVVIFGRFGRGGLARGRVRGAAMRRLTAYLPALLWSILLASLAGATDLPESPALPHLDKLAHFGVYAVLGVLLGVGWLKGGRRPARGWLLAYALLLGLSDEVRHSRMAERTGEVGDWVADALGAATGLYAATRLGRRRFDDERQG
jgi:VanZ family protein